MIDLQTSTLENKLVVHYLDIGQADCILIQEPKGSTVLIDAGNKLDSKYIQGYLLNLGITKIDVLIATHPHADHIGSMDDIIYAFEIGKIYSPNVDHNTTAYRDFIDAVDKKNYKITYASAGDHFSFNDANFQFISPNQNEYDDLNFFSLVTKLDYGNVSFLFMGDAEGKVLNEILNSNYNLRSDVIKIGHHGGVVSAPINFIKAVDPTIAVITVRPKSYSYPHFSVLSTLKENAIETYLTKGQGTIVITSDGEIIDVFRSSYKNTDSKSLDQ
ncbi:MBL fold metallo-hydrolase [Alkalibaculum sporogenes]|uniref:MBL fold metallo-hydrolase n=1 Tax=Alkalibaculum sporogenes TaxID=2655001 RepID=UPI001A9AA060